MIGSLGEIGDREHRISRNLEKSESNELKKLLDNCMIIVSLGIMSSWDVVMWCR